MSTSRGLYLTTVPTSLYGTEALRNKSAERTIVNVLDMKFLRSSVGVTRIDKIMYCEVRIRVEMVTVHTRRAAETVLRRFGYVERMDEYHVSKGM